MCQSLIFQKKETLAQVFSREFCKIAKNIFSYRTPAMVASVSNIYDRPFCGRISHLKAVNYFFQKSSIIDVCLGPK